jgi:hypothetical protein
VLELLVLAGRTLPHAVMMMIPEAFEGRDDLPDHLKGFYAFHSCLMEPWDGPAAVAFTDGRVIGATLDRNGLRPGRWLETKDGWVVLGSETGVMDEPASNIVRKGRLQPGKLFLVDLAEGRIVSDEEVKRDGRRPAAVRRLVPRRASCASADLPDAAPAVPRTEPLRLRQLAFGYTQEDLRVLLGPTAAGAAEPIGSMGNDLALAVLSDRQPPLFSYFKQLFAQVTNPPIDPIRESIVMSVASASARSATCSTRRPSTRTSCRWTRRSCARTSSRSCARSTRRSSSRTRSTSPGRSARAPTGWPPPSSACARRPTSRSPRRQRPDPLRPRVGPSARRSRRCWRSAASTTTSCARARACRPASCSSPASRARSTTSPR